MPSTGNVVRRAFVACSTAAVLCFAGPAHVSAQQSVKGARVDSMRLEAIRVVDPVQLDGHLSEPFWGMADSITEFHQQEPDEAALSTERTVVKLVRDRDALYVGVRAYDSDVHGLRATQLRRDADLEVDDYVMLLVDSFHDRRSGFVFRTNPNGAM